MKVKYNLEWPDDADDLSIEFAMYRKNLGKGVTGCHQKEHLVNIAKIMFPEFLWNKWAYRVLDAFFDNQFSTVWGPAASGKTEAMALILLIDWWARCEVTRTVVCSTTAGMLRSRVWGSMEKFFLKYSGKMNGKLLSSQCKIVALNAKGEIIPRAGIFGIAVQQGTVEQAKSNIIGVHCEYTRLMIDEMQATRRAAVEARANLSKGTKDFKFIGIGNPMSRLDVLGEFSEPVDGWGSISVESEMWETNWGRTYHLDGFKSPAIDEPEKFGAFLINQQQMDKDIREYGADSPEVWTMIRGFVPPDSSRHTVFTESLIITSRMPSPAQWFGSYEQCLAIDPAFTYGGDRCIALPFRFGTFTSGIIGIEFQDWVHLEINVSSSMPILQDLGHRCKELAESMNIPPENICIDDTGTQSLADEIEFCYGRGVHRVIFSLRPSELPVSAFNPRLCVEEYGNRITELWFTGAQFAKYEQIRGCDDLTLQRELCMREVQPDRRPRMLIPKAKLRAAYGFSPDIADAAMCAISWLRFVKGVTPGASEERPGGAMGYSGFDQSDYERYSIEKEENLYAEEDIFDLS